MENGRNWGAVHLEELDSFRQLGYREQNAVRAVISGFQRSRITGEEPKPMRVKRDVTPFDLKAFAGVLHELRIGISDSLRQEEDGAVTFQPKPYSDGEKDVSNGDDPMGRLKKEVDEALRDMPKEIKDLFGKFLS